MVDFQQPETPITIATAGPTGEAHSFDRRQILKLKRTREQLPAFPGLPPRLSGLDGRLVTVC
jgi:hypothetical protein